VNIQLGRLRALLEARQIRLEVDEAALNWLGEAGYDPVYGARPLKRVLQRSVQDHLATMLLEGSVHDGDIVRLGADSDGLTFSSGRAETLEAA